MERRILKRRWKMKRRVFTKASICLAFTALLLVSMTGMSLAGGVLEGTPLGDALEKLDELGKQVAGILVPDTDAEAAADASGSGGISTGLPVPDPGSTLDPSAIPGLDALTGALDPANAPGLDSLAGALDPADIPGLESLPGMEGLPGTGSLPGAPGLPELPGLPAMDPTQVLQVVDVEDQLFLVINLEGLVEAKLGLGKNLEKAPLLELSVILFNALAAEGSLGIKKINDNAFLLPLEVYLKYMAGDEGWKEILDLVVPLELSFPGAGTVPDGVQAVVDALYKFILKPILSLLPIYREVKPDQPTPEPATPDVPAVKPPVEVGGEVTGIPAGGSGDHLPFTGAELSFLLSIIAGLAVSGLLLRRLEKRMRGKTG
jgi:hypothetical protein